MEGGMEARKAVAYLRVSTLQQSEEGVSIDAQEAKARAWCTLNDYDLIGIYHEAISGKSADNRQALQDALKACDRGAALIVYSLSRLTRSTEDAIVIDKRLQKAGSRLISLSESLDTRTAAGRLVYRFFASLAEYERETIVERTQVALDHKKTKQERTGKVPYGHRLTEDGRTLGIDEQEQATLNLMRQYKADGMTLKRISEELAEQGILARSGKPFDPSSIWYVLRHAKGHLEPVGSKQDLVKATQY